MINTAALALPEDGTFANENGCCSYRILATVGIVIKLLSASYSIDNLAVLTRVDLDPT